MAAKLKMKDIAARLQDHFDRWAASRTINETDKFNLRPYFHPCAWTSGPRIFVRYISYQCDHSLTKAEAEGYLAWIEAGNVGKFWVYKSSLPKEGEP